MTLLSSEQQVNSDILLLEQCESIISQGLHELMKVERAFSIIEKQQLYKKKYNDFEDYCVLRWSTKEKLHYLRYFQTDISNPIQEKGKR